MWRKQTYKNHEEVEDEGERVGGGREVRTVQLGGDTQVTIQGDSRRTKVSKPDLKTRSLQKGSAPRWVGGALAVVRVPSADHRSVYMAG